MRRKWVGGVGQTSQENHNLCAYIVHTVAALGSSYLLCVHPIWLFHLEYIQPLQQQQEYHEEKISLCTVVRST